MLQVVRIGGHPAARAIAMASCRQPAQRLGGGAASSPSVLIAEKLRKYSTVPNEDERRASRRTLPRLMEFSEIIWPSALKSLRNWILTQFIIRPYFDAEFTIKDFCQGAKQACQLISLKLASGDFEALEKQGLVAPEAIRQLKPIVQSLSVAQRSELEININDVFMTFPYEIGIMFDDGDDAKTQKRWVEITMVLHMLRGFQEMQRDSVKIPWNVAQMPEYQDRIFVLNYRFKKEYTKGQQSDWTVNVVNHFKILDLVRENRV